MEEVRAHMTGYNIMARDIVAKNHPDSKFNSFKVSVNVVDAEKFNNPFGGVAIIWNSSIKHKLVKIDCSSNRVCGLLYGENDSLTMLLNVYMLCDKKLMIMSLLMF